MREPSELVSLNWRARQRVVKFNAAALPVVLVGI
jgi:hypothetical protein